jgi:hypothetical protein
MTIQIIMIATTNWNKKVKNPDNSFEELKQRFKDRRLSDQKLSLPL